MIVRTDAQFAELMQFIADNEMLAYDTETTGLNPRKDKVIGFGISNAERGYYVPLGEWDAEQKDLVWNPLRKEILEALQSKKLILWNASFDYRFTKYDLKVDLLDAVYADVLLMKHCVDEWYPFSLKEVGAKIYGEDAKAEKVEMLESIRANGGTATEFFKADVEKISKYCVKDCLLSFKLYLYYQKDLQRQNLEKFYYLDEVMPLYKTVTIPAEEYGIRLDVRRMRDDLQAITSDIAKLELNIQTAIDPYLTDFKKWYFTKEYPLLTKTGKVPKYITKYGSQEGAFKAENPGKYCFNLQSKPHLKKLMFDTLKLKPTSFTPTGLPQCEADFIESIQDQFEWAKDLLVYNKLNKIKSTYIEGYLNEVEEDIFYPSFKLHATVSGRFGSDVQQLPRQLEQDSAHPLVVRYTNAIREYFLPRVGNKLIGTDYESLEPRTFAHVSGDKALFAIFNNNLDFYSYIGINTEKLKGYSADKSAENYLGKVAKSLRQRAKAYALGICYGLTAYKLKFELNISEEEAKELVDGYFTAFPDLKIWFDKSADDARYNGYVKTQTGRVRHLDRAKELFATYGASIDNDLELWKRFSKSPVVYTKAKEDRKEYKNLLNNARNFQIQGLAASIVNRASIAIAKEFKANNMQAIQNLFCHDEIVVDCPQNEIQKAREIIQRCMEKTIELRVPLIAIPQVGDTYASTK